jgi:hypothetical protein
MINFQRAAGPNIAVTTERKTGPETDLILAGDHPPYLQKEAVTAENKGREGGKRCKERGKRPQTSEPERLGLGVGGRRGKRRLKRKGLVDQKGGGVFKQGAAKEGKGTGTGPPLHRVANLLLERASLRCLLRDF